MTFQSNANLDCAKIPKYRHPLIYTLIHNACYRGALNPRDNRRSFVQGILGSLGGDPNAAFVTTIPDPTICWACAAVRFGLIP
jgi:hypothetical protein